MVAIWGLMRTSAARTKKAQKAVIAAISNMRILLLRDIQTSLYVELDVAEKWGISKAIQGYLVARGPLRLVYQALSENRSGRLVTLVEAPPAYRIGHSPICYRTRLLLAIRDVA